MEEQERDPDTQLIVRERISYLSSYKVSSKPDRDGSGYGDGIIAWWYNASKGKDYHHQHIYTLGTGYSARLAACRCNGRSKLLLPVSSLESLC